jgi:hypothetical protein
LKNRGDELFQITQDEVEGIANGFFIAGLLTVEPPDKGA